MVAVMGSGVVVLTSDHSHLTGWSPLGVDTITGKGLSVET
jgi:hypothetical protein